MYKHPIIIIIFLLSIQLLSAQKSIKLNGLILDKTQQVPLAYSTVTVFKDTLLVDGVIADEEGRFKLKVSDGFTHVTFSFVGYRTKQIDAKTLSGNELRVELESVASELDEVEVVGENSITTLKIDRRIINFGADIQQSGATALEAFDQIVEIQTDLGSGSISLRGNSNVSLLVNGKPTAMNATELLEQIPASTIDRVEIITAPSAKYQADGLTGIINVILKKNSSLGLNLSVNGGVGTKRYNYGMEMNYNISFFNLRLNASRNQRDMNSRQTLKRVFTDGSTQNIFTPNDYSGLTDTFLIGLDLFADAQNEFSLDFSYTDDFHALFNESQYTNVTGREDFLYLRDSEHEHYTSNFNANYRRKFGKEDHFLEFDYNLTLNNNQFPARDSEDGMFLFNDDYFNDNQLQNLAIDYTLPFGEQGVFESGVLFNRRDLNVERFFEPADANSFQDFFDYQEEVYSAYSLIRVPISERVKFQGGLRYEYFESSAISTGETLNSQIKQRFSNLFPSFSISYDIKDNSTINFAYSKRIARPSFRDLNPFQLGNPFFRFEGNPNLRPEFSDNLEFNYQGENFGVNWSGTLFYRYRTDVIQRIDRIEDNNIQISTFQNLGNNYSFGAEGTFKFKPLKKLQTIFSTNFYYTRILQDELVTYNELYSSNLQLRNIYKINKSYSFDVSYRHSPRRQQAFRFIRPRNRIDFGARARILDDRVVINFRVVDILNANLMKRITETPGFRQDEVWRFQSQTRGYLLNITYKLIDGKNKSRSRKKRNYRHGGTTD
ncbi:TonB-dependent receptor domain-containing protein [Flavobacteriaceae bacterium M23B6Z8]